MCTAFSEKFSFTPGIFPKKLKPFSLFSNFFQKKLPNGYIAKILKSVQVFAELFQKKLSIGYISRIFESVQVFQNFFQKNSLSTDDYQKKYPKM